MGFWLVECMRREARSWVETMGFHGRFCILLTLLAKVCRRRQDTALLHRELVSVSEKDNFPPSASRQNR